MKPEFVSVSPDAELSARFGPASRAMLARAGVASLADIATLGSVETYRRAKAANKNASLNLLWAIEAALSGRDWRVVAREDRLRLLLELEHPPC